MERNMNTNKASRNSSACRPIAAASAAHPVGDESDTDCCDCARAPLAQGADRGSCGHDREHRHRAQCSVRKVNMTISLAFLAPALVKAAIDGHLPHRLGLARLCDLPIEWARQHQTLGLATY